MTTPAAAQEPSQTPIGSKLQITVEQEYTSKGINGEGGGRQFFRVTGEVEVVVPQEGSIVLFEDSDLVLRGLGQGTFEAEREPDWRCDGGSVSGTYNAWLRGGISKGREDFGENKDELNVTIEAYPAPPGLGNASLIDDFEDLGEPGTSKGYEQIESVNCKDRSNPELSVQEGVIGRPMMIGGSFGGIKPNPDGVIEFEESFSGPYDGSRMKIIISPPAMKYKVHGTVKDTSGNPMSASKLAFVDFEAISENGKIKKLSQLRPAFEDSTTASDDRKAEYKFELERPVSALLPELLVVSVLWYDGTGEFAVTNGNEVEGRYIPLYQALCISNEPDNNCVVWKKTDDGFEANVDFVYGNMADDSRAVMEMEDWEPGVAVTINSLMADAGTSYFHSYRAMKYFESIKGNLGNPLNPVNINIHDSYSSGCKNAAGQNKDNAFFDYQAKAPFGGLGSYLEQVTAGGGKASICTLTSPYRYEDAPINREYHELGHYLQNDMYNPASNLMPGRGTPHAGYKNPGSNDSFVEGFAEFVAMLIAVHHNERTESGPIYPIGNASLNLETDYKVWGESVKIVKSADGKVMPFYYPEDAQTEELAIAGLLWDLHDGGEESHENFVVGVNEDLSYLQVQLSKVYNRTSDQAALSDTQILSKIRSKLPMTLVDLFNAFNGDVSKSDLEMIFINHGAFGDTSERDLIHEAAETVGQTGSVFEPVRPARFSPRPELPGSYIVAERNATFTVSMIHEEPNESYDFSYRVNMIADEQVYFEMPPSYYPSVAIFDQVSQDGKIIAENALAIDSREYWNYINSKPEENGIFKKITVNASSAVSPGSNEDASAQSKGQPSPAQPSGCLIATAAFGSELAPQVQFLREFRDNRILSTMAGSSFMNAFNGWYYSFSPQVADYERQQPWLRETVRVSIYPLLGILQASEKAYGVVPGEYGSVTAGLLASALIGAVYITPLAFTLKKVRKQKLDHRLAICVITSLVAAVITGISIDNSTILTAATALLVLTTLAIVAIYSANAIARLIDRVVQKVGRGG